MKSKILGLSISLFILTLLSLVVVSAASDFSLSTNSIVFQEPDLAKTFTINPTTTLNFTVTTPTINDDDNNPIAFNVAGNLNNIDSTEMINVSVVLDYNDLTIGENYQGNIVVSDGTDSENIAVSFVPTFCKEGEASSSDFELSISEVDINNDDGDDEEWSPLDEITVDVEVSNDGDEKVKDVFVELGLLDADGKNIAGDLEFINSDEEEIDVGSISDGDEEKVTFQFQVPADFEADDYKLVIKAYSDEEGEKNVCVSKSSDLDKTYYHEIDGERETDEENHIVVTGIRVSPETAQCGERVQVQGEVFNIGDEDYEDQVKVTLEIDELGVDLESVIREDFDQGDSSDVEFEFDVPEDADEKTYTVRLRTFYDYNDRHDVYEIVSDKEFTTTFKVQGECSGSPSNDDGGVSNVQITADFDSETPEAIPGKQVIIEATLRNTGNEQTTYSVSVSGNSAWSNLIAIDPQTLTLSPGESRDVSIILKVDDDAQGDQEFTIRASYAGETTDQRVLVPIEEGATSEQGQAFADHLAANWFIYLIVIINIILIIAIIAVVRRMLSPRQAM